MARQYVLPGKLTGFFLKGNNWGSGLQVEDNSLLSVRLAIMEMIAPATIINHYNMNNKIFLILLKFNFNLESGYNHLHGTGYNFLK
jgi:hypothetical protein